MVREGGRDGDVRGGKVWAKDMAPRGRRLFCYRLLPFNLFIQDGVELHNRAGKNTSH